jgi:UDP-N-acetylglucosamine 2-epimerase (non-hydrolysing)
MPKLKLATIIGTRPEIIRLSQIIKLADKVFDHVLIHTGQNYDYELNEIFFEELGIRKPDHFLGVAGQNLGKTIGNIISLSFDIFLKEKPDALLVLGDTNSVLSTISAKRLKIPIFHMEAGNRCFDQNVPEEINRKISDHISDVNLAYNEHSRRYLIAEGFRKDHIFVTGTPLFEVIEANKVKIQSSDILERLKLQKDNYFVVSSHREENLDLGDNFENLIESLNAVAERYQVPLIFSTHPRTKIQLERKNLKLHPLIKNYPPFGFIDYVHLQKNSKCVLSDSGTISEESAMLGFNAISLRTSTERPESVDSGTILLGGIKKNEVLNNIDLMLNTHFQSKQIPVEYSILDVSTKIVRCIQSYTPIINRVIWNKNE